MLDGQVLTNLATRPTPILTVFLAETIPPSVHLKH
jgi:hypothetical protein